MPQLAPYPRVARSSQHHPRAPRCDRPCSQRQNRRLHLRVNRRAIRNDLAPPCAPCTKPCSQHWTKPDLACGTAIQRQPLRRSLRRCPYHVSNPRAAILTSCNRTVTCHVWPITTLQFSLPSSPDPPELSPYYQSDRLVYSELACGGAKRLPSSHLSPLD